MGKLYQQSKRERKEKERRRRYRVVYIKRDRNREQESPVSDGTNPSAAPENHSLPKVQKEHFERTMLTTYSTYWKRLLRLKARTSTASYPCCYLNRKVKKDTFLMGIL